MTAIPIDDIVPNPEQPRTYFDEDELKNLAQSIKENTLLVPITIEKAGNGYVIIDGERRWRAVKMLGLKTIEAHIKPADKKNGRDRLLQALIANVQRSGNTPIEEARAFKKLIAQLGSKEAVAEKMGVALSSVALRLELLEFDDEIQNLFALKLLPLDWRVVGALKNLPKELRKKVAMSAGIHRSSSTAILTMCKRILTSNGLPQNCPTPRKHTAKIIEGHFNALAMVDFEFAENLVLTVKETCAACLLYAGASESNCKECPLVDFLRRLKNQKEMPL